MYRIPFTRVPGQLVPAVPAPAAAERLALRGQLEASQWWPAEVLAELQQVQLGALCEHVWEQVPWYRDRLAEAGWAPGRPMTTDCYRRLPVLRREEAMAAGEALRARTLPEGHGEVSAGSTSGSTGRSLRYWVSELARRIGSAFHLHIYCLAGWDFTRDLASILVDKQGVAAAPEGRTYPDWGPCLADLYPSGRHHFLAAMTDIDDQLDWLQRRRPAYLQTYPSNLAALLEHAAVRGLPLDFLQGISTLGEQVPEALREQVRAHFGWPLFDVYSASEVGVMAIQCPSHEHYHVQTANVLLEVLDEQGRPCGPGQTGEVVVTCLNNFAAPLLRYAIGDFAEVGAGCDCGRGQPVLQRIRGRARNMLRRPDGVTAWPSFGTAALHRAAPIRQFQVVQTAIDRIELRLVCDRPLPADTQRELVAILQASLGYPFQVEIRRCDRIERSAGGKYEDFLSLL